MNSCIKLPKKSSHLSDSSDSTSIAAMDLFKFILFYYFSLLVQFFVCFILFYFFYQTQFQLSVLYQTQKKTIFLSFHCTPKMHFYSGCKNFACINTFDPSIITAPLTFIPKHKTCLLKMPFIQN